MIDSLSDVGHALNRAKPSKLQELYEKIDLELVYNAETVATIKPGRGSERVRGASCTLTTRLSLTQPDAPGLTAKPKTEQALFTDYGYAYP